MSKVGIGSAGGGGAALLAPAVVLVGGVVVIAGVGLCAYALGKGAVAAGKVAVACGQAAQQVINESAASRQAYWNFVEASRRQARATARPIWKPYSLPAGVKGKPPALPREAASIPPLKLPERKGFLVSTLLLERKAELQEQLWKYRQVLMEYQNGGWSFLLDTALPEKESAGIEANLQANILEEAEIGLQYMRNWLEQARERAPLVWEQRNEALTALREAEKHLEELERNESVDPETHAALVEMLVSAQQLFEKYAFQRARQQCIRVSEAIRQKITQQGETLLYSLRGLHKEYSSQCLPLLDAMEADPRLCVREEVKLLRKIRSALTGSSSAIQQAEGRAKVNDLPIDSECLQEATVYLDQVAGLFDQLKPLIRKNSNLANRVHMAAQVCEQLSEMGYHVESTDLHGQPLKFDPSTGLNGDIDQVPIEFILTGVRDPKTPQEKKFGVKVLPDGSMIIDAVKGFVKEECHRECEIFSQRFEKLGMRMVWQPNFEPMLYQALRALPENDFCTGSPSDNGIIISVEKVETYRPNHQGSYETSGISQRIKEPQPPIPQRQPVEAEVTFHAERIRLRRG